MSKQLGVTGIQSESKPLLDYSSLYYASHRSNSSATPQRTQQSFGKSKCGVAILLAGTVTALLLVGAIVALTVVISKTVHHHSLADLQAANSSTVTPLTIMTGIDLLNMSVALTQVKTQEELTEEQRHLLEIHADWRSVYNFDDLLQEQNDAVVDRSGRAQVPAPSVPNPPTNAQKAALASNARSNDQLDDYNYEYEFDVERESEAEAEDMQDGAIASDQSSEAVLAGQTKTVDIKTNFGRVAGVEMKSRQGRTYYAFLKVPYAKPPTGERRFRPPEPVDRWTGTLDATVYPPECIQKVKYSDIVEAAGAEDCLYMSIYTPKLPPRRIIRSKLLPVMFYIHGGGFTDGNGTRYGAKYFMDEDVVLVTMQYRIGHFGFLNTKDGDILGNMGLKDQVEALRFIKKIVEYFNGDAKRVLIFGNSAGAQSVAFHLLSPLSSGLFSRAIAQSGSSIAPFGLTVDKNPQVTAKILAERFNCSYGTAVTAKQKLSECLRNVSAADIVLVRSLQTKFMLTIESPGEGAFMSDYPLNLLRAGKVNRVPFMTGVNSGEGIQQTLIFLSAPLLTRLINNQWNLAAPILFQLNSSAFDKDAISSRVREFFFGNKSVSNDTLQSLLALCTDRMMGHTAKVHATYQAEVSPVYLYYLTKRPAKSYGDKSLKGWPPGNYGVAHADELQYMFLYNGYPEINTTSEYFKFSADLVKTWAKFGADGKPDRDWLAFKPKKQELWYNLDDQRVMTDALVDRMKLWDSYSAHDLCYE